MEAEGWISKLTDDDNYRRLLKLAVLRRDVVPLSGLLDASSTGGNRCFAAIPARSASLPYHERKFVPCGSNAPRLVSPQTTGHRFPAGWFSCCVLAYGRNWRTCRTAYGRNWLDCSVLRTVADGGGGAIQWLYWGLQLGWGWGRLGGEAAVREVLVDEQNVLGEGTLWDVQQQRLWWVDIYAQTAVLVLTGDG